MSRSPPRSLAVFLPHTIHHPSPSLLSKWLTDFPWSWLRLPWRSVCSLQLSTHSVLWALALG